MGKLMRVLSLMILAAVVFSSSCGEERTLKIECEVENENANNDRACQEMAETFRKAK